MSDTAVYNIVRNGDGWSVSHDGRLEGDYATKEAAFEAAAAAASNAIKSGLGVQISIPAPVMGEPALGGPA
jgi:hypothetical protein